MSKRIFFIAIVFQLLFSFRSIAGPFFPQDTILACGSTYTLSAAAGLTNYLWNTGATTQSITTNRTGWYAVSALQNGNRISDSVYLNLLYVNIINNDSGICPGNSVVLNAETAFNFSCTGYPAQQYPTWTSIGPLGVIYKWNNTYYIRTLTDVLQSSNLNGPWTSMGFFTQTGVIGPAELLGVDATGRLHVGTTNSGVYVYSGGIWTSTGLAGTGTAGQFFTLLPNGRIIISRSGSAAGIYYSDDNGNTWVQSNAPAITWFYFTVANNGSIFAVGSAGVIRSTDNGTSWTSINNQLGGATSATGISKDCNGTLWVVADRTLYSSSDNGNTWIPSLQIPGYFTSNPTAGTLLAASNGEIYYYGFISPLIQALYVTRDGGMSWTLVTGFPGLLSYLKEIDGQLIACTNQGVYALTLQPQITLQWSTGATTSSITVSPNQNTTYYVTASNGVTTCRDSVKINVGAVYSGLFNQDTIYHCGSAVNVSAPAGYASYQWNTGAATRTISVTESGIYYVQAQPASGCPVFDSVFVNILDIRILNNDTTICFGDSAELSVNPGQGIKTFCFDPPVVKGGNMVTGYHSVAVDASGNYFLSGSFYGVTTIGGFPVSSAGGQDIFVVKYDSCGNPLWVVTGGSSSSGDDAGSIDADGAGNIYFTGRYNQPLTLTGALGSSFTAAYTPSGNGNHQDGFVVKISPSGQILWGATIQGGSNDGFSHVTVDHNDCAIVTGGFNGCCPSTFAATVNGPNGSVSVNSYGANYGTGVMVKFNPAGTILWKATIHNRDVGMDRTAVDASNNIYVVGTFRSWGMGIPADFIDGSGVTNTLYNPGIGLSYLVKLNSNGLWQWGVTMGNQGDGVSSLTAATDVKTDAAGNPWVCGFYSGAAITFYSTSPGTLTQPASSANRGYLVKYSASGVPLFSTGQQQSVGSTIFTGLSVTSSSVAVTGYYTGGNQGGTDGLLLMYDLAGQLMQSALPGGTGDDYFSSIDWNGRNYVVGGATASPLVTLDGVSLNGSCNFLWNATSFGTGSNTILWSTGDTTTSIVVHPTQTTTYYVAVSNGYHSCRDSVTVTVNNVNGNFLTPDTAGICGSSYALAAPGGYTAYQWSTGETTAGINATNTGWYSCTVFQGGCEARDSVLVSLVNANIINNDTTICGSTITLLTVDSIFPRASNCNIEVFPPMLRNGIVAFYPFCGNANDAYGSNNGNVYNASLFLDRNAQSNLSYRFNGTNSSIIPGVTNKSMVNSFTYAFWANPLISTIVPAEAQTGNAASNMFSNPCVIHPIHGVTFGNTTSNAGSGIYVGTNGLYVEEHSDGWEAVPLSYSGNLSGWHHFTIVYNNKVPSLFIDGIFIKSGIPSVRNIYASLGKDEFPAYTRSGFGAGYAPPLSSTSQYFNGDIDDIIYYNRALSAAEIQSLYSIGNSIIWSTGETTQTISVSPTQNTTYYCTVSNGITTCRDSVKITVNSVNAQLFSQDTVAVCGTSYLLQAAPGYSSYQWNTGASSQSINVSATGWYSCTVIQGNCPTTDSVFVSIVNANIINNDSTICDQAIIQLNVLGNKVDSTICNMNITTTNINPGSPIAGFTYGGYFNGHYYYVYNTPTTWTAGELICRQNGGYMVCINDINENNFVCNLTNNNIWIGLFRDPATCNFRWLDCQNITFTNWRSGEPNNGPCGEPYTQIIRGCSFGLNTWNNLDNNSFNGPCYTNMYPILEIDPSIYSGNIQLPVFYYWSTGDTTQTVTVSPSQTTTYYCTVSNSISSCTDSVTITVNQPNTSNTTLSACDSLRWNGTLYTTSGTYSHLSTNIAGCDSTAVLNLTINKSDTTFNNIEQCYSYSWNGTTYTQSGSYTKTGLLNAAGCDSVVILNLIIKNSSTSDTSITACDSYFWYGNTFTQSISYTKSGMINAAGCDSSAILNLTIKNSSASDTSITACDSYFWYGNTFTQSVSYTKSGMLNAVGCDSSAILNLTIINSNYSISNIEQCYNYFWNGQTFTQSGSYTKQGLVNAVGCDSIAILNLVIKDSSVSASSTAACDMFSWNGQTFTQSGSYTKQGFVNAVGCDSTAILNLTIHKGDFSDTTLSACNLYDWNGNTYTQSGIYTYVYLNSFGCNSADTLHLTVSNGLPSALTTAACDSYFWNGTTYSQSGDYLNTIMTGSCSVTDTLHLTIHSGNFSAILDEGCNIYNWNGVNYTQTGTYTYNYSNSFGCASTDTLYLIINNSTFNATSRTACESYAWNGTTYTQSGTYTHDYSNSFGCPSTDTLYLSVKYGTFNSVSQSACRSYIWNNNNYNNSGTYWTNYVNTSGCPSADSLRLTIFPGPSLGPDQNTSICFGKTTDLTGLFNSQSYNTLWTFNQSAIVSPTSVSQPGNYYLIATDNNGCKDSAMVSLSVQPLPTADAGPDRYEESNQPFTLSGSGGNSCLWSPAAALNDATSCNPQAVISANTLFVLTVYDNAGCTDTDTVLISLLDGPEMYIPNAFTPNGDGLNDAFGPITVGITELEYFRIYNRYGELVFETSVPTKKWNGFYKGKLQDTGNFVWIAAAKDRNGKAIFKKGNVTLIR